jgi:hypothetical protein
MKCQICGEENDYYKIQFTREKDDTFAGFIHGEHLTLQTPRHMSSDVYIDSIGVQCVSCGTFQVLSKDLIKRIESSILMKGE